MKKETKIDLWFVFALFLVMVIAPILLRFFVFPRLEPQFPPLWSSHVYWYIYSVLPWLCFALALVHVFVTKRLSLIFFIGVCVFLYLATTFMSYCMRPEDPLMSILSSGLIHMLLLYFIPGFTIILQGLGLFVLGRLEEHKAKRQTES